MLKVVDGRGKNFHSGMGATHRSRLDGKQAGGGRANDDNLPGELICHALFVLAGQIAKYFTETHRLISKGRSAPIQEHTLRFCFREIQFLRNACKPMRGLIGFENYLFVILAILVSSANWRAISSTPSFR